MYCPPSLHDNHSKHLTLDQFKKYWLDIYNKSKSQNRKYKLIFTGGEVTSNKDFLPFLAWLRDTYSEIDKVLVTTNGSATFKYYQNMYKYVDNISFSVHSEFIKETRFFNTIIKLKQSLPASKFIHVNIMDEYWNRDRIDIYRKLLTTHNVSYSVLEVHLNHVIDKKPVFKGKLDLEI